MITKRQIRQIRKACDHSGQLELQWQLFSNGKLHLRSTCTKCGRFMGHVSQTYENLEEAQKQHVDPKGCTWDAVPPLPVVEVFEW